jgi:hypothetical protein
MSDYFHIVYINTRSPDHWGGLPYDVKNIRDWTWRQSAQVYWSSVEPSGVAGVLDQAHLVVLDWSSQNASEAERVCRQVRGRRADLPILLISETGPAPRLEPFVSKNPPAAFLRDPADPTQLVRDLEALRLTLPPVRVVVHPEPNNLTIKGLVDWVGKERLQLMIQKHFPDAENAYPKPVGGGWSEAKLCRFFVDTDEQLYFLKFFTQRDDYKRELAAHAQAKAWLGDAVVNLFLPDLAGGLRDQSDLFPESGFSTDRVCYPVCYESASNRERPRETFKDLYREQSEEFIEKVLVRLLDILATGQPDHHNQRMEPPWNCNDKKGFCLNLKTQIGVLDTCDDLARYGPALFGDQKKWEECRKSIQGFAYDEPLPSWLTEGCPVIIGHMHGDPNPRNCLVNPDDPNDVRLIDCGDYRPDGRLVSDLALIERDVKLVLMGTENSAGRFFDLDVTQLPDWCEAERYSISRGLDYRLNEAPLAPRSVKRAYRLIERVRQRAKQVCGKDLWGQHYFAALLYWTLDVLKYPALRPTKKLLALYSVGETVRHFASLNRGGV